MSPGVSLNYLFYRDRNYLGCQRRIMRNMQVIAEQHLQCVLTRFERDFGAGTAITEVYVLCVGWNW